MLKLLVVGCGSIGQKHIRNLKEMPNVDVVGCRLVGKTAEIEEKLDIKAVSGLEAGLAEKPDAVVVTTPTSTHIPISMKFAEAGCHLFIEKPLSHNLEDVDKLLAVINDNNLICMIGYNLRFHPNLRNIPKLLEHRIIGNIIYCRVQVGQYLPDWHPDMDYRTEYSAKASLGGGALLDLSHEVDYIRWLLGDPKEIASFLGTASDLEIETEDVADILLRFENGIIGEVHVDYIQRIPTRTCEIIGDEGTIICDLIKDETRAYTIKDGTWKVLEKYDDYNKNQVYIDEMNDFLNCIRNGGKTLINEVDGKRVLEIITAAKESNERKKFVSLVTYGQ